MMVVCGGCLSEEEGRREGGRGVEEVLWVCVCVSVCVCVCVCVIGHVAGLILLYID
jgi:hypothetical protein